jgi:hypothetical protein
VESVRQDFRLSVVLPLGSKHGRLVTKALAAFGLAGKSCVAAGGWIW